SIHSSRLLTMAFVLSLFVCSLFVVHTTTTVIYTLSLHDALPISMAVNLVDHRQEIVRPLALAPVNLVHAERANVFQLPMRQAPRSEEHTSELQSRVDLVCRLLLEKKKKNRQQNHEDRYVTQMSIQ